MTHCLHVHMTHIFIGAFEHCCETVWSDDRRDDAQLSCNHMSRCGAILAQATIASKLDSKSKARPPTTLIAAAATGADTGEWNCCVHHKTAQQYIWAAQQDLGICQHANAVLPEPTLHTSILGRWCLHHHGRHCNAHSVSTEEGS